MSLAQFVQRIARTVVPQAARYNPGPPAGVEGGHWTDHSPIASSITGTAPNATWAFGNLAELLAAAGTDLWVEALELSQHSVANAEYHIGITMEAGAGAMTVLQAEAIVAAQMNAVTEGRFVKIDPPVFIPAGARIAFAVAGDVAAKAATIHCWAIHSANK